VLLGPSAAVVVMSTVLILQCLMFADGGITALGANIFNMAVVAPVVGYGVYLAVRAASKDGLRGRLVATGFGAWVSTVAAAIVCAGELAASGTVAWRVAYPAMAGVHMVIGLGEAAITMLVVAALARARPELLQDSAAERGPRYGTLATYGVLLSLGLVVFVAPVASGWPDGLAKVAAALGFAARETRLVPAPLPRYAVPGLGVSVSGTMLAGGLGTAVAFVAAYLLARVLTPHRPEPDRPPEPRAA
jgi:cobalt/nickel transport system permease protein